MTRTTRSWAHRGASMPTLVAGVEMMKPLAAHKRIAISIHAEAADAAVSANATHFGEVSVGEGGGRFFG